MHSPQRSIGRVGDFMQEGFALPEDDGEVGEYDEEYWMIEFHMMSSSCVSSASHLCWYPSMMHKYPTLPSFFINVSVVILHRRAYSAFRSC